MQLEEPELKPSAVFLLTFPLNAARLTSACDPLLQTWDPVIFNAKLSTCTPGPNELNFAGGSAA